MTLRYSALAIEQSTLGFFVEIFTAEKLVDENKFLVVIFIFNIDFMCKLLRKIYTFDIATVLAENTRLYLRRTSY